MKPIYKVHCFYIFLILISIIIGLISVKWSEVPKLVDYITFALTLSSLILAALAITYSVYSNSSINSSLGEISHAATDISQLSRELKSSNTNLQSTIQGIPEKIDLVERNLHTTNKEISHLRHEKERGLSVSLASPTDTEKSELSAKQVSEFLQVSSILGLEFLYMASLSCKKQIPFSIPEICKSLSGPEEGNDQLYITGYQVAVVAIGLVSCRFSLENRESYFYVHETINKNIESTLINRNIEMTKDLFGNEAQSDDHLRNLKIEGLQQIQKIAAFFGHNIDIIDALNNYENK